MENRKFISEKIKKTILGFHLKGKIIDEKEGTYGVVYIVDQGEKFSPRYIAYKTIKKTLEEKIEENKLKNFAREARIWFRAKGHALILTPFYITHFEEIPLICMPFCDKDLESYLRAKERLNYTETLVFTTQVLKALTFAEDRGIMAHQDLKPSNILLEDLSKKFKDFPPSNVHESIKFKVRLADFGLANAWKEIGKPQGSFPYMAPEQYTPSEYRTFNPDVFAVGVIIVEMLTGLHPCGKKTKTVWRDWNRKKWEQWAKNGERKFEIGAGEVSKELENLLLKMLSPNPEDRPSKKDALSKTINLLSRVDEATAEQLKLLIEYYDALAGYLEEKSRLDAFTQICRLPELQDVVINELLKEISNIEKDIDTPRKAVWFCENSCTTSKLLLQRGRESDKEKVENFANRIIEVANRWKAEIKAHHMYPELKFRETILIERPSFRDFEVYALLIGYGREILEKVIGKEETEKVFENKDSYTKSAYFYTIAADYHSRGDEMKAIEMLDKCIKLNPEEAVFYYMKALWTKHYLFKMEILKKLENEKKNIIKEIILENIKKAIQIAPNWKEAKKLYEECLKETQK
jgi:serine/threonine protein kinase